MHSSSRTHPEGIVVGCDLNQQWLLPWWWKHYSAHNSFPVAFVDFGMSQEACAWCRERGEYIAVPSLKDPITLEKTASASQKEKWEARYGEGFWICRPAWLHKPFALLHAPFAVGLWLDLDCQVRGSLEPLFHCLRWEGEIALVRDRSNYSDFLLPGELYYNSGVLAFRQGATILHQWVTALLEFESQLPGDQEILSRAIFLHKPPLIELHPVYNWPRAYGPNEEAIIYHFCGGQGKIEILKNIRPDNSPEFQLVLQSLKHSLLTH